MPRLLTTQADLHELTGLLRRDHDVVTFDLRGLTSASDQYTFDAFLSDLVAVLAELGGLNLPSPPMLVGPLAGRGPAVHFAAEYPIAVAELVLLDEANPVPEPFVTDSDLPEFRAMAEDLLHESELAKGTACQVLITGQDILALRLAGGLGVLLLGDLPLRRGQLESHNVEPLALAACYDLVGQLPLDAIGLAGDQGAFSPRSVCRRDLHSPPETSRNRGYAHTPAFSS